MEFLTTDDSFIVSWEKSVFVSGWQHEVEEHSLTNENPQDDEDLQLEHGVCEDRTAGRRLGLSKKWRERPSYVRFCSRSDHPSQALSASPPLSMAVGVFRTLSNSPIVV